MIDYLQEDRRLLLGAVGSWFWQGQVFNYRLERSKARNFLGSEYKTEEYDDAIRGYSITVGKFGKGNHDYYAVGSPKGQYLKGEVTIMNQGLGEVVSFVGTQVGAFFGYSQATGDFDNDGRDDLAVGAPFYSEASSTAHDEGCVFVFYQRTKQFVTYRESVLLGMDPGGRFGHSLASLGDINNDNYDDLCIGAPYGGENGRGSIFVYHGSSAGLKSQPSQVITAESISPGLTTFGFSLTSKMDVDNNGYPDLAVGAYESNAAVLLRTRPIVYTSSSVKAFPDTVRLKDTTCLLADGSFAVCFQVEYCLRYSGKHIPDHIYFNVSLEIDSNIATPRAFIQDVDNSKNSLKSDIYFYQKYIEMCENVTVVMKNEFRDKLSELKISFVYEMIEKDEDIKPILDGEQPGHSDIAVRIWKDCGKDSKCIPDLRLSVVSAPESYLYGSDDLIPLRFKVSNHREAAYESTLILDLPPALSFTGVNMPVEIEFIVNLRPKNRLFTNASSFIIHTTLTSANSEAGDTISDNSRDINISVVVEPFIFLRGASSPEEIIYNTSHSHRDVQVQHIYELKNSGHVDVYEGEVLVLMPDIDHPTRSLTKVKDRPKVINGSGSCRVVEATQYNESVVGLYKYVKPWRSKEQMGELQSQNVHTLTDGGHHRVVSQGLGWVTSLFPHLSTFHTTLPLVIFNVTTNVTAIDLEVPEPEKVPIWIIIVSVVIGVIIIVILIILLARLGFFKRYKPPHQAVKVTPEEKPLRYNSY